EPLAHSHRWPLDRELRAQWLLGLQRGEQPPDRNGWTCQWHPLQSNVSVCWTRFSVSAHFWAPIRWASAASVAARLAPAMPATARIDFTNRFIILLPQTATAERCVGSPWRAVCSRNGAPDR